MKILIAENDYNICTLYKYTLGNKHDIIICNTGESCIDQFNNHNLNNYDIKRRKKSFFDIVILDYQLPGINGIDVAKELIRKNPDQRIIFISAYSKSVLKNMIEGAKKIEVVQKPFHISDLIQLIEKRKMYDELELLIKEERNISSEENISIEQTSNLFRILVELNRLNNKENHKQEEQ